MELTDRASLSSDIVTAIRIRYPHRDLEDSTNAVELLVDVTFVLALGRIGQLLTINASAAGLCRVLALLLVVFFAWQVSTGVACVASMETGLVKAVMLFQTGMFLLMAVTAREAFTNLPGGLNGPVIFGLALVATHTIGNCTLYFVIGAGRPVVFRNAAISILGGLAFGAILTWALLNGHAGPWWMLAAYSATAAASFAPALPTPLLRKGIGPLPDWEVSAAKPFAERFLTVYLVGCALGLELLEIAGSAERTTAAMLVFLLLVFVLYYLLFWLYEHLAGPAEHANDMRTSTLSRAQRLALTVVGYFEGHMMMVSGLILIATSLKQIFLDFTHSATAEWATVAPRGQLALLYGGVAACLAGQFVFGFCTSWGVSQWPRLAACAILAGAIPVLGGRPILLALAVLVAVCAALHRIDYATKPGVRLFRHGLHGAHGAHGLHGAPHHDQLRVADLQK
jgi:low temperature requirement protein LtrA